MAILKGINGSDDNLIGAVGQLNTFLSSTGSDTFNGSTGFDIADYSLYSGGSLTLLPTGQLVKGGGGGTDTLVSINSIVGSLTKTGTVDASSAGTGVTIRVNLGSGTVPAGLSPNSSYVQVLGIPSTTLNFALTNFDNVIGTSGNDFIAGNTFSNSLQGGGGNDSFYVSSGNDSIDGGAGTDTMTYTGLGAAVTLKATGTVVKGSAGGGNLGTDKLTSIETIVGQSGQRNAIDGSDVAVGQIGPNGVDVVSINANLSLATNNLIVSGLNNPTFTVTNFLDVTGTNNNDTIKGSTVANILNGLAGNDSFIGTTGSDTISGGDGNDSITYSGVGAITLKATGAVFKAGNGGSTDQLSSVETINAQSLLTNIIDGSDVTAGQTGPNGGLASINVNLGTNSLIVNGLNNPNFTVTNFVNVKGTGNSDSITGSAGNNVIFGTQGDDTITGGGGTDTANYSTFGDDISLQATGLVVKHGGLDGTDTLSGIKTIIGNSSFSNTIDGSAVTNGQTGTGTGSSTLVRFTKADLSLTTNNLTVAGLGSATGSTFNVQGFTNIIGTGNNDNIKGSTLSNSLSGGAGLDTFTGTAGCDSIDGGTGADTISYTGFGAVTLKATGLLVKSSGGTDTLSSVETITAQSGQTNLIDGSDVTSGATGPNGNLSTITVDLSAATNNLTVGGLFNPTFTVKNFVNVKGTGNNDSIKGSTGNNVFFGTDGSDTLNGLSGIDTADYSSYDGDITLKATGSVLKYDVMCGLSTDTLTAIDTIVGNAAKTNTIDGSDVASGTTIGGTLVTINANLSTQSLNVTGLTAPNFTVTNFLNVTGTGNNDTIKGDALNNTLDGSAGDDTLVASAGNDTLGGGLGADIADYSGINDAITLKTGGLVQKGDGIALGTDQLTTGIETVLGKLGQANAIDASGGTGTANISVNLSSSSLQVQNTGGPNINLNVVNFSDVTSGTANVDTLTGNSGANVLNGFDVTAATNTGDVLTGGGGADTFVLGDAMQAFYADAGVLATIADFSTIEGDKLRLNGSSSNYATAGDASNTFIALSGSGDVIAQLSGVSAFTFSLAANSVFV